MVRDTSDALHFVLLKPDSRNELGEQLIMWQPQEQHFQQSCCSSQISDLNDLALEQGAMQNSIHGQLANQSMREEQILALQQQQRQLEIPQQIQQQQQLFEQQVLMQEQNPQAMQLLDQLVHHQLHDPRIPHCSLHVGSSSFMDQALQEQQLVRELQQRTQHRPRRTDPYFEQLIGQVPHREHQPDLLKLAERAKHEEVQSLEHQIYRQEQLEAWQAKMGLRHRPEVERGRPTGSAWPMDELGRFLSTRIFPLEVVQQHQRSMYDDHLIQQPPPSNSHLRQGVGRTRCT